MNWENTSVFAELHGRFHDLCGYGVQLCRVPGVVLVQKARVAAQLAKLRQLGEHLHFALVEPLVVAVVLLQGSARRAALLLVGGVRALLLSASMGTYTTDSSLSGRSCSTSAF